MTDTSSEFAPSPINPFPATAVASGTETVTVETPALREARHLLAGYLTAPPKSGSGNIIAIVGDYGTGKTHLAAELLRHIRSTAAATTYAVSIEASTGTFILLYQTFVTQLDHIDVMRRVREYYTDIVAEDLGLSELTANFAPRLRSGELDPVKVVDQLNLMDSDLLQRVRRKLEDVTNKEEFSTALTLLLRTGFDHAVWEWFRGGVPDQILVDRGINDPIATDADALEAMGVFALLYGNRGHQFVVVIDELDKLLSTSRNSVTATLDAFKKLLQVFVSANALLILVGLPDYIEAVGATVVERIGRIVRVSALTADHAEEFIRRSQQEAVGVAALAPFTHDTVRYLVEITDGVARRIVRLCHHLYRKAVSEKTPVTEAMVREAARAQVGFFVNIESVRREVRRTLDAQRVRYSRNHLIGPDARTRVDYWIPLGDRDSGCAILLTESVFGSREVRLLNERAILMKDAVAGVQTVLVVVGYLPSVLSQELTEIFGIEPLIYDHWTFNESLAAIVGSPLQSTTVARAPDQEVAPLSLPRSVITLFDEASSALSSLGRVDGLFREVFAGASRSLSDSVETRMAVRTRMASAKIFEAMGVVSMQRTLLTAFRDAVAEWYHLHASSVQDDDKAELGVLCRSYDVLYDFLPLFRLQELDEFELLTGGATESLHQTVKSVRLTNMYHAFGDFSARVRAALLLAVSGVES